MNWRLLPCIVAKSWLHRYITGSHRLLPRQTVVRLVRVGLLRLSAVMHCGQTGRHRISTLDNSHVGVLRFHPLVLRWKCLSCQKSNDDAPDLYGISRLWFRSMVCFCCFQNVKHLQGHYPVIASSTRFIPIQYGVSMCRYGC